MTSPEHRSSGAAAADPRDGAKLRYVLITPARNEADFIELTIKSVVAQTARPLRWLIVSDGSIDATDEIVGRYKAQHDWIDLLQRPPRQERHFGGKVAAFRAGYELVRDLDFDVVASLDADLSFEPDYFAFLLGKLAADPRLGLTGTPFSENGKTYDFRFSSVEHVSGACQVFRRACYESFGGYQAVKGGGIDVIAVLSARMKGWTTRTWPERSSVHHRPMGTGDHRNPFAVNFALGQRQYRLGFHPLWQTFRAAYQLTRRPYFVGGTGLLLGFYYALIRRSERSVSPELVAFQQALQMQRLRRVLKLDRSPQIQNQ